MGSVMSHSNWTCWRCGAALTELIFPISRRDECPECGAELSVCRMCKHHARRRANWCLEERAEPPRDPEAANFCDYFAPRPDAYAANQDRADDQAKAALEALFGGDATAPPEDDSMAELKSLFKDPPEKS